jgi:hypothetical protein
MRESAGQEGVFYSEEIEDEINKAISNRGTKDFSEAKEWYIKAGLGVDDVEQRLIKKIVAILSQYISNGLLQLTIEEIVKEKEYKDAIKGKIDYAIVMNLEKKLPPFKPYVEFVVKSGLMELKKIKYDFVVEPKVKVKEAKIKIHENEIESVTFGSLIASITLYLLKGNLRLKISSLERSLRLPGPISCKRTV